MQILYPGDGAMIFAGSVFATLTVVLVVALSASAMLRWRPAARHAVLLSALVCALGVPVLAWLLEWSDLRRPWLLTGAFNGEGDAEISLDRGVPDALVASRRRRDVVPAARAPRDAASSREAESLNADEVYAGEIDADAGADALGDALGDSLVGGVSVDDGSSRVAGGAPVGLPARYEAFGDFEVGVLPARSGFLDRLRAFLAIFVAVWCCGAAFLLLRVVAGARRAALLRGRLRPISRPGFDVTLERVARRCSCRELPAVGAGEVEGPVAVGVFRPVVILPAGVLDHFGDEALEHILIHEIAHATRRDALVGCLQRLFAAAFWVHPLVLAFCRQLTLAREQICDNHVLRAADSTLYARTLLTVAEHCRSGSIAFGHTVMPRKWTLEERISEILDTRRETMIRTTPGIAIVSFFSFALLVLAGAALSPSLAQDAVQDPPKAVDPVRVEDVVDEAAGGDARPDPVPIEEDVVDEAAAPARVPILSEIPLVGDLFTQNSADRAVDALVADQRPAKAEPYRASPGDSLRVRVWPRVAEMDIDGEYLVEPEGTLPLSPVTGRIPVAGRTLEEVQDIIKSLLAGTIRNPSVLVSRGRVASSPLVSTGRSFYRRESRYTPGSVAVTPPRTRRRERSSNTPSAGVASRDESAARASSTNSRVSRISQASRVSPADPPVVVCTLGELVDLISAVSSATEAMEIARVRVETAVARHERMEALAAPDRNLVAESELDASKEKKDVALAQLRAAERKYAILRRLARSYSTAFEGELQALKVGYALAQRRPVDEARSVRLRSGIKLAEDRLALIQEVISK